MKGKKIWSIVGFLVLLLFVALPVSVRAQEEPKTFDLLFVHDVHSHLNTFTTRVNGENVQVGGLSRIMTLAKEQFAKNPDTLFLDAGDFSMGTVVQSIFETDAAELRTLGALGIAATTFGNHEFDYGPGGLANSMMAALKSGDRIPAMIVSNIDWDATKAEPQSDGRDALLAAMDAYGLKEYMIFEKGDVKVAVFGIFGKDALDCAPFSELIFTDPVEAAKKTVKKIQENEDADIIVCLSHSGTWEDESVSEDEILAKNVPAIDIIVSGHTHTALEKPIVHGSTYIVSAGEYGKNLGKLSLSQKENDRWEMTEYALTPITPEIPQDAETQATIDKYLEMIDVNYLSVYGYTRLQVLAENDVEFVPSDALGTEHTELNLGSIMADSYRYTVESLPEWDGVPVDVAVVPAGLVRDSYIKGNVTVEDVYNSFSLGAGEDKTAGYPLLSVYFTGAELKLVAEIDASLSTLVPYIRLYTSGLHWTYNPHRLILSKAYDAHLMTMGGERLELEDDKLYRVVADLYSAKLIGSVTDLSYGLIKLQPKHADGTPVEDYSKCLIMTEGRELKAWEAIARYMESFEDTDGNGVPNVPESYGEDQGRKVVEDSRNLWDLVKHPNKYFFLIIGVVLLVLALIACIVVLIVKLVRHKKGGLKKEKARMKK